MENKLLFNKSKIFLSSLVLAVILFLVLFRGLNSGHAQAQADIVRQTAKNLSDGFQYFYSDQNRFPSAFEFSDQPTMLNYFNIFPGSDYVFAGCTQNFIYKRISDNNYQLSFCLAASSGNYQSGWNTINGTPTKD